MSMAKFLEKAYFQKTQRYKSIGQRITDYDKLNLLESVLYGAFHKKRLRSIKLNNMPTEMFDDVYLKWLDSTGKVEMSTGRLSRIRNFSSSFQAPSGSEGEFAVQKNAFGKGMIPELVVEEGETKVLKAGVIYDYKRIHLKKGARLLCDKSSPMFILLANESLTMDEQSRIEWIGEPGDSPGDASSDDSLNGETASPAFETFNGFFNYMKNVKISDGGGGKGSQFLSGKGGESAGVIWIEAKMMRMAPSAAIRSIGGNGGTGEGGNGSGGNGGAVVVKVGMNINVTENKIAVTEGRSAGKDGFAGIKVIENLY